MSPTSDIANREDVTLLVHRFYDRLLAHPELGPVFDGIDLPSHLPRIVHFWSFVLLDEDGYKTNVFDRHMHLPLKPHHFAIWADLFCQTVKDLYTGPTANIACQRAQVLAHTFSSKWEKLHGK